MCGFLYDQGTFTTFDYPGAGETHIVAINNQGVIIGTAWNNSDPSFGSHAFTYRNGHFTDLALAPGITNALPLSLDVSDINDAGVVVGTWNHYVGTDLLSDALVSQHGVLTDLNSFLPANSGWTLDEATGIN